MLSCLCDGSVSICLYDGVCASSLVLYDGGVHAKWTFLCILSCLCHGGVSYLLVRWWLHVLSSLV